ncbi:MAG: hypothetical protein LBM66_07980 [Bifidobacteriaceae bacterium]|jgi:hypothetical protein|nr:hypothetical protein [Bifidobacteriaceae bacterium]
MKFSQPLERCLARGAAAAVAIGLATAGLALAGVAANADGRGPDGGVTTSLGPAPTTAADGPSGGGYQPDPSASMPQASSPAASVAPSTPASVPASTAASSPALPSMSASASLPVPSMSGSGGPSSSAPAVTTPATTTPTANAPVKTPAPAAPTAAAVGPIFTCQTYLAGMKVRIKDLSKRYIKVTVKTVPGQVPLFPEYRVPKGKVTVKWGSVSKTYTLNKSKKGVLKLKAPRSVKTKKVNVIARFHQKRYTLSPAENQCGVRMAEVAGIASATKTVKITKK